MNLRDALEERGRWFFRYRSYLPLLLVPLFLATLVEFRDRAHDPTLNWPWEVACELVAFAGLAIRALTVGFVPARTSGRNTSTQVAEVLNTTGMYSIVRHPLYLGNGIAVLGIALFIGPWWMVVIVLLVFALYYERIMLAEEAYLRDKFGDAFEAWARCVPAMVPNPRLWRAPALQFSLRTVIGREYHGAVAILATFAGLHVLDNVASQRHLFVDPIAIRGALIAALVFVICRFLQKRTTLLRVRGR